MNGAETIVIGGGILGATTLWELAREGMEPLLLEAGRFAGGSTAKSGAIVRCHYSNPEVVRMAVRSRSSLHARIARPVGRLCGRGRGFRPDLDAWYR